MPGPLSDISIMCPLCKLPLPSVAPADRPTLEITCARCGSYKITLKALPEMSRFEDHLRPRVAEWVRSQNRLGSTPEIKPEHIAMLRSLPMLQFNDRARRLLLYIAENTGMLGQAVIAVAPEVEALLQTFEPNEIGFIAEFLEGQGWLQVSGAGGQACLTGIGVMQADEWRRTEVASLQGFVAMWFHADLESAWTDGFVKAIGDAGYKPQRIDKKEHVNKICDEIIAEIRRSRFVVADFTGHRGGVYFEAGYAMGRGLPVIWTCRRDDLKELHFDVRQYNCIEWADPTDLAERLEARISAVIGDGPLKQR